jgi:hypothetical protein
MPNFSSLEFTHYFLHSLPGKAKLQLRQPKYLSSSICNLSTSACDLSLTAFNLPGKAKLQLRQPKYLSSTAFNLSSTNYNLPGKAKLQLRYHNSNSIPNNSHFFIIIVPMLYLKTKNPYKSLTCKGL